MRTCREKNISSLLICLNSRFWILGTTGRTAKTFPMNGQISQRRFTDKQWMALQSVSAKYSPPGRGGECGHSPAKTTVSHFSVTYNRRLNRIGAQPEPL